MALEIADAVIEPAISAVKDHIISVAKEEFRCVWYLRDDVNKTSKVVEAIQKWREVAEKKQLEDNSVREWLSDFKNVVYDVEDLVFDHRVMVVEVEDGLGVKARWMGRAKDGIFLLCGIPLSCLRDILPLPVTPRIEISHRLHTINKNLIEIEQRRIKLSDFVGESSGHSNSSTTTLSSVAPELWEYEEQPMVGRDKMKAEIKEALLKHSTVRFSKLLVVGIVGVGGMGKTTLAHSIFNDDDVKKGFEVNKWQYVGEKIDIKKIMNEILSEKLEDLTELHSAMRKTFREKSVLVVLDDAWSTNDNEWKLLQSSLSSEAKAHTLIVTARNKAVTRVRCPNSEYLESELVAMPDSECMEVFKSYAFMGNKDAERRFKGLSKKVVEKLKGIPLAARMMGGFLNKYLKDDDRSKWLSIVNNMELPNRKEGNVVNNITGLSYFHLPQPLRSCFAYCAMFPKGFQFYKEDMVWMWIAQGYIQSREGELMENIGKDYFEDLCQMPLLVNYYDYYYTMHDLIHDFAIKIFTEGCQLKANDTNHHVIIDKLSENIRHLSIEGREFEPSLNVYRKLRTLICYDVTFFNLEDVLVNQFRYLRVLVIHYYGIWELPDSIRHLNFLQYLNVSDTRIQSLPEAVCDLINLQFLILPYECQMLPEGMSKLVKLRYLRRSNEFSVKDIKDIGSLTSLQGCNIKFTVLNKSGWRISELKKLNYLHGTLTICHLKHVNSKREAEQACLKDKRYLQELKLDWDDMPVLRNRDYIYSHGVYGRGTSSSSSQVVVGESSQVMEALSPPPFIKSLIIDNYGGVPQQLPCWMDHLPETLVELTLHNCGNWERLPKLGTRLSSLKILRISGLKNVRKIGPEFYGDGYGIFNTSSSFFPRLEKFELEKMHSLEEWSTHRNDQLHYVPTSSDQSLSVFPSLTDLTIWCCPKLRTLSSVLPHLRALQNMVIDTCDELTSLVEQNEGDIGQLILSSLKKLGIWSCPKLIRSSPLLSMKADNDVDLRLPQQLPFWVWMDNLPSTLVELELYYCAGWEHLPKLGTRLWSLKLLRICGFENVRKIGPEFFGDSYEIINASTCFFPLLEEFYLFRMDSLEEWSIRIDDDINRDDHVPTSSNQSFSVFPSLTYLYILSCPKLRTLSSVLPHLTALTSIKIKDCCELRSLVEHNEGDLRLLILPSLNHLDIDNCPKLIRSSPLLPMADSNDNPGGHFSLTPSLNTLTIVCNKLHEGAQVSRWMKEHRHQNLLTALLVELDLTIDGGYLSRPPMSHDDDGGGYWEHLPTLGQLPSLGRLTIHNIHNVRKIGPEFWSSDNNKANKTTQDAGEGSTMSSNIITSSYFPRLHKLWLWGMKSLEEWTVLPVIVEEQINYNTTEDTHDEGHDIGGGGGSRRGHRPPHASSLLISVFPCLEDLWIWGCPKLRTLSSVLPHLRALQDLNIHDCPELVWLVGGNGASEDDDHHNHHHHSLIPSLKNLSIEGCPLLAPRLQDGGVDRSKIPAATFVKIR